MSQNSPSPDTSRGQSLPAGTHLEEFVIERVLGVGGFGITYLAKDSRLERKVVIKENLPAQFCWRDSHALTVRPRHTEGEDADNFQYSLESFEREASTLASLDHPGIVKVLRSFEAYGTAYFVMPFVEGIALDEVIRQRTSQSNPFTEAEIQDLLTKVLDALGYLHERGIYHRDIKPGNLLMTKAGPVLIDFGAARQRLSERSLTVIESAGYTPFEQLQSRGKIGPWSDIYALGATLFKAITGETPAKATDRAFDDPETPLSERADLRSRYSSRILQSIDKAMSPKASDRFQGAGQWRGAMVARREIAAPQVSVPQREQLLRPGVPPPLPTVPAPVQGENDNAKKQNRRKTMVEYSFAIFIAGLFLICILLLLEPPPPTTPPQPTQAIAATASSTQQTAAQSNNAQNAVQEEFIQHPASNNLQEDRIAAELGNIDAQFRLGIAYATGRGVTRDDRQAIAWFEKAATGGHQGAVQQLNSLGKSSIASSRTPELPDLSAAEAGNIDAQFRVGIAYMTGRGVPRDDPQAIAWFRKAAAGGHEGAKLQLQYQYLEPPR